MYDRAIISIPYLFTGIGVLFSHLPIEQYRSIAWFNVASGLLLLGLFIFLFHGEVKWNKSNLCGQLCNGSGFTQKEDTIVGMLSVFIS